MKFNTQAILDRFSIGVSMLCAIHCAFMPILLSIYPVIQTFHADETRISYHANLVSCAI